MVSKVWLLAGAAVAAGVGAAAYRRRKQTGGSGVTGEAGAEQAGELTATASPGDVTGKPERRNPTEKAASMLHKDSSPAVSAAG